MSTANEGSPTAATAPAKADADSVRGNASRKAGAVGDPPSGPKRAAAAATDARAPPREVRLRTDADIQNERHSDPPVWRDDVEDLGGASDGTDEASLYGDGAGPPELKKSKPDRDARSGLLQRQASAASAAAVADDEDLHMDRCVFEVHMPPGDVAPAELGVAVECDGDAFAESGPSAGGAGLDSAASDNSAYLGDSQGRKPRPGAPALADSRAGLGGNPL